MPPTPATSAHDEAARRIRTLVAEGDLDTALEQLRDLTLQGPRDLADEAFLQSGRLARLNKDSRKGTITPAEADVLRNRLALAIQSLLDDLVKKLPSATGPVASPAPASPFAGITPAAPQSIIGINNLKQIAWLQRGIEASRAVCRVLTPTGMGSGFLIGPRMLMTNNHVIPTTSVAAATKVEFNYQYQFGRDELLCEPVRYELDPGTLFRTSEELDYTVVAVAPTKADRPSLESWGVLRLNPHADPIPTEHVVIIQHANGGPKQIALSANAVLQVTPPWLHYSTDTLPGSSGSPVFNDLWQVIAIHHAEGPDVKCAEGYHYSNEGVLASAIKPDLGKDWPA